MATKTAAGVRLLSYLQSGRSISTVGASRRFGITRDSVRARITELRKDGHWISTITRRTGETAYQYTRTSAG